jgi:hypothetical protein
MDASIVDLAPGPLPAELEMGKQGALLVYVLVGRLYMDVGGMREVLETGDSLYLESDLPVAWGSAGKQRCRALLVLPNLAGEGRGGGPLRLPALDLDQFSERDSELF